MTTSVAVAASREQARPMKMADNKRAWKKAACQQTQRGKSFNRKKQIGCHAAGSPKKIENLTNVTAALKVQAVLQPLFFFHF